MKPTPTGRVQRTAQGRDIVLTRTFRAPIEDVWASVTESERTARWFGPWEGRGAPGETIRYWMAFEQQPEEGPAWSEMTIDACDAPRLLELSAATDYGSWSFTLELEERDGVTELRFTHHVDATLDVGSFGPGWEYYLDNLVASRDGAARPDFADYYPSMKDHYAAQATGE
ncbi:MAG TPA: SRPBCC family protein [Longimicrobiales bacterium]